MIERDFAGETRRFKLVPANPARLYFGLEDEGVGLLPDLARRAVAKTLGVAQTEAILAHALSRGHPLTLRRMRDVVREEMHAKPLLVFADLATAILADAYVGPDEAPLT